MTNITLHYHRLNGVYNVVTFPDVDAMIDSISETILIDTSTIRLVALGDEIIISQDPEFIVNNIELFGWEDGDSIHIQEYQSFESAYAVALGVREPNPKCYASAAAKQN